MPALAKWYETLVDRVWLPADDGGAEEAEFIKKALRVRKGQVVLDAPCGAGRIAFHLARAGCTVTGVDIRHQFVARARDRFLAARLSGNFLVMDLRKIDFTNEFHGVFNWFGSFGYFSESENSQLIGTYARALRKGGRLLIDQVNRERILRNFISKRQDGNMVTRSYWKRDEHRLVSNRIIDGHKDPKNMSSMRLYTPGQMRDLFKKAGLIVEEIFGSSDGEQFGRSSRRLIIVGRKI